MEMPTFNSTGLLDRLIRHTVCKVLGHRFDCWMQGVYSDMDAPNPNNNRDRITIPVDKSDYLVKLCSRCHSIPIDQITFLLQKSYPDFAEDSEDDLDV